MDNLQIFRKVLTLVMGLFFFFSFFNDSKAQTEYDLKWELDRSSSLHINGETNLNDFTCSLDTIAIKDTLIAIIREEKNLCVFFPNEIKVSVNDMVCENAIMTKDLQKTLQSDQYPYITINFITVSNLYLKNKTCEATFWLTIGNKRKLVRAACEKILDKSSPSLIGKTQINFSDFNIEAPEKFFGAVVVKNELTVSFDLAFKAVY